MEKTNTTIQQENEQIEHVSAPQIPKNNFRKYLYVLAISLVMFGVTASVIQNKSTSKPTITKEPTPIASAASLLPSPVLSPLPLQKTKKIDTSDWLTYTDKKAGFRMKYPKDVTFGDAYKDLQMNLYISTEKLTDIPEDLPMAMGRDAALAEKERLMKAGEGNIIKNFPPLRGEESMTLAQFEVCSILFDRRFTFYPGEYRVSISLSGAKEKIVHDMPKYFKVDQESCGTKLIWDHEKIDQFRELLNTGKGDGAAQEWYDTFDAMINSIERI
jgi:hypothetical protein